MYDIIVGLAAFLLIASGMNYVYQSYRAKVDPVMSTWILLTVMMTLSLVMYWQKPDKTLGGNIAVTAGFVNLIIILVGVTWVKFSNGTLRVAFTARQQWCLASGLAVIPVWWITQSPLMAYTLVQLIGLIAYKGTVDKLRETKHQTEPLTLWICVLIASVLAIYPAYHRSDIFAWIYIARAVPSTAYVVYLINRTRG